MMGVSSKKQTQTSTPTVAPWLDKTYQDYAGKVTDYLSADPTQFVAGPTDLQRAAFQKAQSLGSQSDTFENALAMANRAGSADASTYTAPNLASAVQARSESLLDGFDRYLDPSTQHLVEAALRNYDAQSGRQGAALQAQQARTGAFGGSRAGIAQGEFAAATDRGRALTEGELRANAFRQAAQMADADAGRRQSTNYFNVGNENDFLKTRTGLLAEEGMFNAQAREAALNRQLQAAGLTADIGATAAGSERADLGLQADLGEMARQIEQARLGAPVSQLGTAASLYGAIPVGAYTSQKSVTKSNPGLFNAVMDGVSGIGGLLGGLGSVGVKFKG